MYGYPALILGITAQHGPRIAKEYDALLRRQFAGERRPVGEVPLLEAAVQRLLVLDLRTVMDLQLAAIAQDQKEQPEKKAPKGDTRRSGGKGNKRREVEGEEPGSKRKVHDGEDPPKKKQKGGGKY